MEEKVTRRALLGAGLAIPLIAGCGSGSGSTSAGESRGTLSLTFNFQAARAAGKPAKTRAAGGFIPLGTRSVRVSVTDAVGSALAPAQLVTAPFSGTGQTPTIINVSFPAIPAVQVNIQAAAFPDATGTQAALATGAGSVLIAVNSTTSLVVPLMLTLSNLSVTPTSEVVAPGLTAPSGSSAPATASAVDSSGRLLLYPFTWLSEDPGIADVTFDPANPANAIVHGIVDGNTTILVIEPNSGGTASVSVRVGG